MPIDDLAGALKSVNVDLADRRHIAAATDALRRAIHAIDIVTAASGNPLPRRALAKLTHAARCLAESAESITEAIAEIDQYADALLAATTSTSNGIHAEAAGDSPHRPPDTREPRPPPDIERIGRALPARTNRRSPTVGEFNGERIVSGEDERTIADLRRWPNNAWPRAISAHVESHVAARMRREGLSKGVLVQNNRPCGNRGYDADWPHTCERYLPGLLPLGARLTIWATTDGGNTWWTRTYIGTGEGIAP